MAQILLVSTDLQARVRLQAAVAPLEVVSRRPDQDLGDVVPTTVVLDLDQLGAEGASRWADELSELEGVRLLGFFSHVDTELGRRAGALGIETIRRGRFWKAAGELLAPP